MKFIVFVLSVFLSCCLQNPIGGRNVSPDASKVDTKDTSSDRSLFDVIDLAVEDVKSDPDMVYTPPNFPDPNRVNQDTCTNNMECNRISACMYDRCSQRATGCGWFARPHPIRDIGCLLNEYGTGQEGTAECEEDSDCPSNMPNCILRMCQVNEHCEIDSDCIGEQFCDYNTWCSIRAPCREDGRCWRGGCRSDGLCSYPSE